MPRLWADFLAATAEPTTAPTTAAPTTAPTTAAPTTIAPTTVEPLETYVVKEGDTVYMIALKLYDDPNYMNAIGELNGFDPDNAYIEEGQILKLPAVTE